MGKKDRKWETTREGECASQKKLKRETPDNNLLVEKKPSSLFTKNELPENSDFRKYLEKFELEGLPSKLHDKIQKTFWRRIITHVVAQVLKDLTGKKKDEIIFDQKGLVLFVLVLLNQLTPTPSKMQHIGNVVAAYMTEKQYKYKGSTTEHTTINSYEIFRVASPNIIFPPKKKLLSWSETQLNSPPRITVHETEQNRREEQQVHGSRHFGETGDFPEWENIILDLYLDIDQGCSDFDQSFDLIGKQPTVVTYNCSTKKWDAYEFRPSSKPRLLICLNYSLGQLYDSSNVEEYLMDDSFVRKDKELTLCDDFIQTCVLPNTKTKFVNLCIECNKISQQECIMNALKKSSQLTRSREFREHQVQIYMPWSITYSTTMANTFNSYFDDWSRRKNLRVICAFDNENLDKSPKHTIPAGLQHHIKINVGTKDQHNTLLANNEMAIFSRIDLALEGSSASNASFRAYHYLMDNPDATRESCQDESLKKSPYSHKLVESHPNFINPLLIYLISLVVLFMIALMIGSILYSFPLGVFFWILAATINTFAKEWFEKKYENMWKFYCNHRDTLPAGDFSPKTHGNFFCLFMGFVTPIVVAGLTACFVAIMAVCMVILFFVLMLGLFFFGIILCMLTSLVMSLWHMDLLRERPFAIYTSRIESWDMNYHTRGPPLWNGTVSVMKVEIACNSWFYGFAYHLRNNSIGSCIFVTEIYVSLTNMTRNDLWELQDEISTYQTEIPNWYLNHKGDTSGDTKQHIGTHLELITEEIQKRATLAMEKTVHYLRFFAGPQVLLDIGLMSGIMESQYSSYWSRPHVWRYSDWDTTRPEWLSRAMILQRSNSHND
jgi:hypothetical protein